MKQPYTNSVDLQHIYPSLLINLADSPFQAHIQPQSWSIGSAAKRKLMIMTVLMNISVLLPWDVSLWLI